MGTPDPEFWESTCRDGLKRLRGLDMVSRTAGLGARESGRGLIIPFFGVDHRVTTRGVENMAGRPVNPAVATLLLSYILRCPQILPGDGPWITFREFSGAGPLMGYFAGNTNKLIEISFSENGRLLETACLQLGARAVDDPGFDISMEFSALPRIPVRLRFNLKDPEFPAQCSLLFRQSAQVYLDLNSMAVAGTWLAGNLTGFQDGGQ